MRFRHRGIILLISVMEKIKIHTLVCTKCKLKILHYEVIFSHFHLCMKFILHYIRFQQIAAYIYKALSITEHGSHFSESILFSLRPGIGHICYL